MNPVILLDEVDKLGADWRGDPSSALLEVLDPAQNSTFRDHYLDVQLDLSQVLFIATANMAEHDPAGAARPARGDPARRLHRGREGRDRRGLPDPAPADAATACCDGRGDRSASDAVRTRRSPTTRARRASARSSAASARCCARPPRGSPPARPRRPIAVDAADVRDGPRPAAVLRRGRRAHLGPRRGDRPRGHRHRRRRPVRRGVRACRGKGTLTLTGQLGDVMQESATIALSYVRSQRRRARHRPAGLRRPRLPRARARRRRSRRTARRAGVTMTVALVSLLTGRSVRHDVGMTGEVTLQGRVLPVGGIKQKVLAAHRAGLTDGDRARRATRATSTTCRRRCARR